MISAAGVHRDEGFPYYAIDNGAWSFRETGDGSFWLGAHAGRWHDLLVSHAREADFVVAPDIVCGGAASLDLSLSWIGPLLLMTPRVLIPVQDGHRPADLAPYLGARVGVFVGGSTPWKEATLATWGALGRRVGCWVHAGRMNSARKIRLCHLAEVTSFDGSGPSRFADCLERLDHARQRATLPGIGLDV